ncbi:MAG: hypothetical protein FJ098_09800 [Deltaproteobacteria bacterium]|nr:hypothetical protein [Deltaproteobacteria bacterium]
MNTPSDRVRALLIPACGLAVAGLLAASEALLGLGWPGSGPVPPLLAAALGLPAGMIAAEALADLRSYGPGRKGFFLLLGMLLALAGSLAPWPLAAPPSVHGAVAGLAVMHELIDYRPTSSLRLLLVTASLLVAAWHELLATPAPASLLVGLCLGISSWCLARIAAGGMR